MGCVNFYSGEDEIVYQGLAEEHTAMLVLEGGDKGWL